MIPHALHGLHFVERFYSLDVTQSTNQFAKASAHLPSKGMFVIQANRQTAGRGRQGNSFFSDSSGGLWVSFIVPVDDISNHFSYNRALSLAIAESILKLVPEAPVGIKWPNDIFWGDRKICGILLENHESRRDMLIIGFGLNVNIAATDFPEELRSIATSLLIETGRTWSQSVLLRQILVLFNSCSLDDRAAAHARYRSLLRNRGKIALLDDTEGIFEDVEADGRIRMKCGTEMRLFNSGTLSFLK